MVSYIQQVIRDQLSGQDIESKYSMDDKADSDTIGGIQLEDSNEDSSPREIFMANDRQTRTV